MGEVKEVNGIICIPLPAMTVGNHVLSTTYTDTTGKYQTENHCFNIKVISSTVDMINHTTQAKPNCSVKIQVGVKNELQQPVNSGRISVLYASESEQTSSDVINNNLCGDTIGEADVVDGVAKVNFTVPSDFRGGAIVLRLIYDNSEDGYSRQSIATTLYILRDGQLKLNFFTYTSGNVNNISSYTTPIDEFLNVPVGQKLKCVATLYDDTDANHIPLKNVPINMKMNGLTFTTDIDGGEVQVTDDNGQVSALTNEPASNNQILTINNKPINAFMITAKNEAKQFVGENEVETMIRVARESYIYEIVGGTHQTVNGVKYDFHLKVTVKSDLGYEKDRPVGIKINSVSMPENGNFGNPDHNYEILTNEQGVSEFFVRDISLQKNEDYDLEVVVGGGDHITGYRQSFGSIRWATSDNDNDVVTQINWTKP